MRPEAMTCMPFSGLNRSFAAAPLNITHRSALWLSFSVK